MPATDTRLDRVAERRRAAALARHYRNAERLSIAEIARRLGRAPATVKAYLYDPTGEKARAVKTRYRGYCRTCGADTSPRNGKGDAYLYCRRCRPGAVATKWTCERVREAMRRWAELYGRAPSSYDWSRTHAPSPRSSGDAATRARRLAGVTTGERAVRDVGRRTDRRLRRLRQRSRGARGDLDVHGGLGDLDVHGGWGISTSMADGSAQTTSDARRHRAVIRHDRRAPTDADVILFPSSGMAWRFCRTRGADTSPRNGKGDAYLYCRRCPPGAAARKWTRERVREAMRKWAELYGRAPWSYDWSRTHARRRGAQALRRLERGEWPSAATVNGLYGTWAAALFDAFAECVKRVTSAAQDHLRPWRIERSGDLRRATPERFIRHGRRILHRRLRDPPRMCEVTALPLVPPPTPVPGQRQGRRLPLLPALPSGRGKRKWTRERVREAMRRWAALYDSAPSSHDWSRMHTAAEPDAIAAERQGELADQRLRASVAGRNERFNSASSDHLRPAGAPIARLCERVAIDAVAGAREIRSLRAGRPLESRTNLRANAHVMPAARMGAATWSLRAVNGTEAQAPRRLGEVAWRRGRKGGPRADRDGGRRDGRNETSRRRGSGS